MTWSPKSFNAWPSSSVYSRRSTVLILCSLIGLAGFVSGFIAISKQSLGYKCKYTEPKSVSVIGKVMGFVPSDHQTWFPSDLQGLQKFAKYTHLEWMTENCAVLCSLFFCIIVSLLMALNFGARAPLEPKQKPIGARQTAETNESGSFLTQVSKMSEFNLSLSDKLPETGKITTTHDADGVRNDKKHQMGSNDLSIDKSKDAPTDIQKVSTPGKHEVNGPRSSLESSTDQEKKTSERTSGKNSSVSEKTSDGTGSLVQNSGSGKISGHPDLADSGKSSMCRGSTSTDVSDESNFSSFSSNINKPHKTNDVRWEAIQAVRSKDGSLGLSHFRLLKRLGCGGIGSVYLAELSGTKCYFAMKVMDKASLASRKKLRRAQTEREILQSLDHPLLPSLYSHFETDKVSCLVMEFCPGGDLHTLRQRQPGKHFSEQAVKFYVAEVLLALEYLHMLGIIYRDLKPENVLVREDGHIMLSDFDLSLCCSFSPTLVKTSSLELGSLRKCFGCCVQPACIEPSCIQPSCVVPTTCFSRCIFSSKSKKDRKPKNDTGNQVRPLPELVAEPSARSMSFVGTHEYLAPEIIKLEGHGSAVDWWTFGIFLYELLFGKTPFKGSGNLATLFNVVRRPLRFPESPAVSFAARDLIRGLLIKKPQNRLGYKRGAAEIKQHPFFEGVNWALIRRASPPEVP